MKGLTPTITEKNPYEHNGESLHISPHTDSTQSVDTEGNTKSKKLYIESFGCQMNFSDSEVVASILSKEGYQTTNNPNEAHLALINTCSIREKAEHTVRKRLKEYQKIKSLSNPNLQVGVLGCMAERLKSKFLEEEKIVDLVVGPDAYRDLPILLKELGDGQSAVNVILSKEETYGDIKPIRLGGNGVTAFVSITRGCDNACTFCVVPFTRGRERSRDPKTILQECKDLYLSGYKEITLLGQNVDSYLWYGGGLKKDFHKTSPVRRATAMKFAGLLEVIATELPNMRIRFSTSNPQDMSLAVIRTMSKHQNICKHIHLPVQSGSTSVLKRMNRQHTREEYLELTRNIRQLMPHCAISHDMIAGFCGETEQEHQDTLSLMEEVKYNFGYMFAYSERPGTFAFRKMEDDLSGDVKKKRLQSIIELQNKHSLARMNEFVGQSVEVLVEKESKKSKDDWAGRNSQNAMVVFPKTGEEQLGDYTRVKILNCTRATLIGQRI